MFDIRPFHVHSTTTSIRPSSDAQAIMVADTDAADMKLCLLSSSKSVDLLDTKYVFRIRISNVNQVVIARTHNYHEVSILLTCYIE